MFRRTATALGLGALLALAAPAAAQASVSSGYGGYGYTQTQCMSSPARPVQYGFSAKTFIHQDYAGQNVAMRQAVYDARGWLNWSTWSVSNAANARWSDSPDVEFVSNFTDLRPYNGYQAWLAVQYAWQNTNGTWRIPAPEVISDYTDIFGGHSSYCYV